VLAAPQIRVGTLRRALSFSYDPATDRLDALDKITARATQNLSRFDLDFQQLAVKGVEVNDRAAAPRSP
jgi:hypothetical protein